MKKFLVFMIIVSIVFMASVVSVSAQEELDIAFSVPSLGFTFFANMEGAVEELAEEMNINVTTFDARDDLANQVADVEDMIVRDFDGVMMVPIEVEGMAPSVESLVDAGIPTVTVDRYVDGVDVLSHVGADNVEGGRMAAHYIAEKLGGEGKVLEMSGTPGASPTIDRGGGFNEVMEEEYPEIEILDQQTGRFMRGEGMSVMEDLLAAHPEAEAIFCHNDDMALGALEAIDDEGRLEDMIVVGFDAIEDALNEIEAGRLDATIEQFPQGQSQRALEILAEYVRDGVEPDPEVYLKPAIITEDNLDEAEIWD